MALLDLLLSDPEVPSTSDNVCFSASMPAGVVAADDGEEEGLLPRL